MIISRNVTWAANQKPSSKPSVVDSVNEGGLPPPPIALVCHYVKQEQTDKALSSLLKFNPEIQRVYVVDTSVEQTYSSDNPKIKILRLPNGLHADGVNLGLEHIIRTQFRRRDKRVLLIDSDVEFQGPIKGLPEGVLVGQLLDRRNCELSVRPRIRPCFCVMDFGFLHEHSIKFHDWGRISPENRLILGHDPMNEALKNPEFHKARKTQKTPWYDVGSTIYESVDEAGGKIVNFDWGGFMIHAGGGSWR